MIFWSGQAVVYFSSKKTSNITNYKMKTDFILCDIIGPVVKNTINYAFYQMKFHVWNLFTIFSIEYLTTIMWHDN